MNKTPLMAAILVSVVALLLAGSAFSQGGPNSPDCHKCVRVADITCHERDDPFDTTGCESVTFRVPCEGDFYVCANVICADKQCTHCRATANLLGLTPPVNDHIGCTTDNCQRGTGSFCGTAHLYPNTDYTLSVCLLRCGGHTCTECNQEGCRAVGYVYNSGASCPAP